MKRVLGVVAAFCGFAVVALQPSCSSSDNVVGKLPGDTLVVHDTTRIHDTTTIHRYDTLRFYDTSYIARGPMNAIFCGVVYDLRAVFGTPTQPFDSVYAGVTVLSNPVREDLSIGANAAALPLEDGQRRYLVSEAMRNAPAGYLFPYLNALALLPGALYEGFAPVDTAYRLRIVKPVYPTDTSGHVTYDTVLQVVRVPQPIDTPLTFSWLGTTYPMVRNATHNIYYHIVPPDSSLRISWPRRADFYTVSVSKLQFDYYGDFVTMQPSIDTFVTDTGFVVPAGYLALDTAGPDSLIYVVVQVDVIGINGTLPQAGWDTLPAFQSQGMVIALTAEYTPDFLLPPVLAAQFGKRLVSASVPTFALPPRRAALDVYRGVMEKMRAR
jgi:hypothetical protein